MINMRDFNLRLNDAPNGLPERWELLSYLEQLTAQSQDRGKKFTTVLIRLEPRDKAESHHHRFDIELQQYTASTLRLTLRDGSCQLFKYSSDEFMGVFPDADKKDVARIVLEINQNFVRRPFLFSNKLHSVKVKIGVSTYPQDGNMKEDLLRRASVSACRTRINRFRFFSWAGKFKTPRLKPVLTAIMFVAAGALLFFAWDRLDAGTALKSAAARVLLGTSASAHEQFVKVTTKSGSVFQGFLISESNRELIVSVILDNGQASVTFPKAEVTEVIRGKKAYSLATASAAEGVR